MKPYYDDGQVTIYHGDCREILPSLDPADLLLTDPPYGIPAGAAVKRGPTIEDWATEGHNVTVDGWRALVNLADSWVVEFGAQCRDGFAVAAAHMVLNWQPSNVYALVKSAPAPTPRPGFASAVELAVVSRVGKPKWHAAGYTPNRWIGRTPNQARTDLGHPTQKPIEPMQALIRALSPPKGLVLDPFAGSGTTLHAARDEGRRSIGIEMEERYCEIAARRLDQGVLSFGEPA